MDSIPDEIILKISRKILLNDKIKWLIAYPRISRLIYNESIKHKGKDIDISIRITKNTKYDSNHSLTKMEERTLFTSISPSYPYVIHIDIIMILLEWNFIYFGNNKCDMDSDFRLRGTPDPMIRNIKKYFPFIWSYYGFTILK